ncbi:MAG: ABC-type transport system, ATP-binding component, partial [Verrucomicrobiota bacterium]
IPLLIQGRPYDEAHDRAVAIIDKVGLKGREEGRPNALSGGQQQRVAIARALVHEPPLLICDEPTSALDKDTGGHIMQLVRDLSRSPERCVVVVTHDHRIFRFADRIAEMAHRGDGRRPHQPRGRRPEAPRHHPSLTTPMFKKRILLFVLALAGAVAALQLTQGTANETPIKPPPYEPATRDKDGLIAAAGLIEAAAENTLLGSPTSGTVAKVHVKVWDKVKAGDPILTLDERDLRAQHAVQKAAVSAAEATAERAEDAARRWTGIKDSGAVSASELLSYQMAAKEAKAKLALAKAQLDQTAVLLDRLILRSPIDATVLQVGVRVGEFVAAGAKAPVVLGDITRLQIRCDVDEQLATRMREGLPAKGYLKGESSLAGGKDRSIALKFVRIEPFVIPKTSLTGASIERVDTRVLQVIYQFDRPAGRALFVGQQMDVYIDASQNASGK